MFEKGHVYPLPQKVLDQIDPNSYVEVSLTEVEATQRRQEDEAQRLDELNRAAQRRPLVIEDEAMGEAALNPLVGRPVVTYPDSQRQERADSKESGAVVEVEDSDSEVDTDATTEEKAKQPKDFRKSIVKK